MSFPLMVRAIRLALEGVDIKLEQAARTLGRAAGGCFHHYVAADATGHYRRHRAGLRPLAGEFGATITFVSNIPAKRAPFLRRCIP
jgi:molybdate transport system permease protein